MVRSLLLYIGILSFFVISCQKETSFEIGKAALGSLLSSAGECLPKVIGGTYKAGQAVGDSNYIDVTINITQIGNYTVSSDTVNGYSFKVSGNTSSTGDITVRLKAAGTPVNAGVNNFTIRFDGSTCIVPVTVASSTSSGGTAVFTLQGSPTSCSNAVVSGTYTQNSSLTVANKVVVQVNVTTVGSWSMNSTIVTGFGFSGSGTFTTTGVQTITLNATGTPTTAGAQNFTISAGASTCTFPVTVLPNTAPSAVFTLQGSPGNCMNAVVAGNYVLNTPLSASNTVTIQINVTTVGQWAVSTNTVSGMTFTGMGTLAATGNQTLTLVGSGIPLATGTHTLTVTTGTATCTFPVTVGGTAPPPSTDHYILTQNSWWSYDDDDPTAVDTFKRTNKGSVTFNSNNYREVEESENAGTPVWAYYIRKDAATNFYYEYAAVDDYSLVTFNQQVDGDILFLKEGLTNGATWNSAEWSGTDSLGAVKLRYTFLCTNANVTVTHGGKTFPNTYKVTMKSQTQRGAGAWTDEGLIWEFDYAQGVGLVWFKLSLGVQSISFPIRNYAVF
ncbi:MAG: hypothetical protein ACXWV9_03750 [Flavisolibacter sp.]